MNGDWAYEDLLRLAEEQAQRLPQLDLVDANTIRRSNLNEERKQLYLDHFERVSLSILTVEPRDGTEEHLDNTVALYDLSVLFYQEAEIEGCLSTNWPVGFWSAEGYHSFEIPRWMWVNFDELGPEWGLQSDMDHEMGQPEPITMAELNARQQEICEPTDQMTSTEEDENDGEAEEIRQRFEEWKDFGQPKSESTSS